MSTPPTSPMPSGTSSSTPPSSPSSPKRKRVEDEVEEVEQPPTKVAKTASTEPESPKRKREIEDDDDLRSLFGDSEDEAKPQKVQEPVAKKPKTSNSTPDSERPTWWVSDDEDDLKRKALARKNRQKRMKARGYKKEKPAPLPEWYGKSDDEDEDENGTVTSASEDEDEQENEHEDDGEDDDHYQDPNRLLLYDNGDGRSHYKKNQVANSHENFFERGGRALTAPRRTYQQQGDPDAWEYDSDYEDTDYEYARDPDDDDDRQRVVDFEEYDSDFETKEISSGKIKMPEYKLKDEENEEITGEEDDIKKAWKVLNGLKADEIVKGLATEEYVGWKKQCEEFFSDDAKKMKELFDEDPDFPKIESEECGFGFRDCVKGEKLGICQHDVLRVLKGSGVLIEGEEWVERLKKERMRWHPDRFARQMQGLFEDEAKEMFQMIQVLVEKEEQ